MNQAINTCITGLNNVGRGFCGYAAGIFVQSSVLIVLLLVIDFLLRKRVRAVFRYCVWMLVFVKLVLPPTLCLPTGIGYWFGDYLSTDSPVLERPTNVVQHEPVIASTPGDFALSTEVRQIQPSHISPETASPVTSAVSSLDSLTWQAVIFLLWLLGVLVLSVLLIQRMSFVKRLVAQSEPANERLLGMLEECRCQIGIGRNIELKLSNNTPSPAVCGLFKPIVLMPVSLIEKLSSDKLRAVIIHELAHIKRGDLWVNSIQTFLQIIYFYNPFVWLANAVVRRIREQAVDEMVLVSLGTGAKSYSNTLIDIAEMAFFRANLALSLISVAESKKSLERRLKHMLTRPIPKSAKVGVAGLLIVIVAGAILLPMAAAATKEKEENKARFSVTLPNGVTVDLVGICDWPEEGRRCWRPDGSELPAEIYAAKWSKSPRAGDYGFMFKVNGPEDRNFSWNKIEGTTGWEGSCKVSDAQGNELEGFEAAISDMKQGQISTTIRIGIATGPWTTIASHDGRRMKSGRQGGVLWSQAFQTYNDTHIVASSEWKKDQAERVVAIDNEGILHRTAHGSVASGQIDQLTASFHNLKVGQIEKFLYQTRPYQWATFRNVSLRPGLKTNVQVEVETVEQQEPQIETNRLVGYWSFDGNANDRNRRYNGIVHGATLIEGISGQAYHFDGEDYITIEDLSLAAFSFSAWVKTETEGLNNRRIFLLDQGRKYYALQGNTGGGLSFGIAGGTHEGDIEVNEYDWRFEPGKWTHIVVTFDGSTAKIYKDGRLTETGTITEGRLKGIVYIGGTTSHRGAFWQGAIDEVAIFDGVLSAEKIDRLYNTIRPSVRLVIGENRMTFEGKNVTWEQLPALLEKIPNRGNTVFEIAVSTKDIPLSQYDAARGRASKLVKQFGFEYLSYVGQHPLGSKAGRLM
jgi:beta-lactamase regulating signal transducer with metallopeptidase domain